MAELATTSSNTLAVSDGPLVREKPVEAADVTQEPGDIHSALEAWEDTQKADDRGEDVLALGKALARVMGARLAAEMLDGSDMSLREIQDRFGFQPGALSDMTRGKTKTGPTLWKLFALAEALGYQLDLKLTKKS